MIARHYGNRHGRSEEARMAVLEAADDLLAERGFAGVTIEGIAARAQVAKQTIYRWWTSKTDILFDALAEDAAAYFTVYDGDDLGGDLRHHLRQVAVFLADTDAGAVCRALAGQAQHDPEVAARFHAEFAAPQRDRDRAPFRRAQARGELPDAMDIDLAVDQLVGPVYYRVLVTGEPVRPEFTDALVDRFLANAARSKALPVGYASPEQENILLKRPLITRPVHLSGGRSILLLLSVFARYSPSPRRGGAMRKAINRAAMFALSIGVAFAVPGTAATAAMAGPVSQAAYASFPGRLYSVAAVSASNVWAVGGTNWFSPSQPLAEHWNGSSWTQVTVPNPAAGGLLNAVAATSASNAWAVGSTGPNSEGTGQQTLTEHWNGKTWDKVPSPDVGTLSILHSVTIISADNVWAVGQTEVGGLTKALVLYWNGRRWTVVPSDSPGGNASLLGVTASWTHNVWAVGYTNPSRCSNGGPKCQTLIEHWNSIHSAWRLIPSPNPPSVYINILLGISAVSRTDIWAVGSTDFASTLIVHWNGTSWN